MTKDCISTMVKSRVCESCDLSCNKKSHLKIKHGREPRVGGSTQKKLKISDNSLSSLMVKANSNGFIA